MLRLTGLSQPIKVVTSFLEHYVLNIEKRKLFCQLHLQSLWRSHRTRAKLNRVDEWFSDVVAAIDGPADPVLCHQLQNQKLENEHFVLKMPKLKKNCGGEHSVVVVVITPPLPRDGGTA